MRPWYVIENIDDIPSPAILVYPERIEANLRQMILDCGDVKKLRPHVKTHKLPQVIRMKLALGITKFKTSTIAEAEMAASEGAPDVLLAYQPVGPNIARLIRLIQTFPSTRFSCLLDCKSIVEKLSAAASVANVDVSVLVDLKVGMDRTGIEAGPAALELYRSISNSSHLVADGLHAYDGHLHDSDAGVLAAKVRDTFAPAWQLKHDIEASGLPSPRMVVSGTPTSAMMATDFDVEVGAGTTVLWDAGQPQACPEMKYVNAAVLISRVISHPTLNRICTDLGHKAVASEFEPPRVDFFGLESAVAITHSEEHLTLQVEHPEHYPVGTVLYGLPHHICPTMALHQAVWCVRDGQAVEAWPVTARVRCLTI